MSLKIPFKISKTDKIYVKDDYICNGHWLVNKNNIPIPLIRAFVGHRWLADGSYLTGSLPSQARELKQLIPSPEDITNKYHKASVDMMKFVDDRIHAVKLVSADGKVICSIGIDYYPLAAFADEILIKDQTSQIVLNYKNKLFAVVMPVRL